MSPSLKKLLEPKETLVSSLRDVVAGNGSNILTIVVLCSNKMLQTFGPREDTVVLNLTFFKILTVLFVFGVLQGAIELNVYT